MLLYLSGLDRQWCSSWLIMQKSKKKGYCILSHHLHHSTASTQLAVERPHEHIMLSLHMLTLTVHPCGILGTGGIWEIRCHIASIVCGYAWAGQMVFLMCWLQRECEIWKRLQCSEPSMPQLCFTLANILQTSVSTSAQCQVWSHWAEGFVLNTEVSSQEGHGLHTLTLVPLL